MKKTHLLIALLIVMVSCSKDEDCDCPPVNTNSAQVSIKVLNNDQQAEAEAIVRIISSIPSGETIYSGVTDASGICNAGKVLEGQYGYFVSAQIEQRIYSYQENFQVISGEDKIVEVNPFLNVGTAKIHIIGSQSVPTPDIMVAIIPHPNYSNEEYYFNDLIEEAYFIGTTNEEGLVVFEDIPAGLYGTKVYSVMAFYNSSEWEYPLSNNSFYMYMNEVVNETIYIGL